MVVLEPQACDADDSGSVAVMADDIDTPDSSDTRPCPPDLHRMSMRPEITFACYHFLRVTNLSSMPPDDVNFLESQACFKVPNKHFMDELLRSYFRYVHPVLPVVDEASFWSAYDEAAIRVNVLATTVPVVLLQAMLFSSCNVSQNGVPWWNVFMNLTTSVFLVRLRRHHSWHGLRHCTRSEG